MELEALYMNVGRVSTRNGVESFVGSQNTCTSCTVVNTQLAGFAALTEYAMVAGAAEHLLRLQKDKLRRNLRLLPAANPLPIYQLLSGTDGAVLLLQGLRDHDGTARVLRLLRQLQLEQDGPFDDVHVGLSHRRLVFQRQVHARLRPDLRGGEDHCSRHQQQ